jgi:hypothetical protein
LGVVALVGVVLFVALRGPQAAEGARLVASSGSGTTGAGGAGANAGSASGLTDDDLRTAASQGVSALEALRDKYPREARVLRALATAEVEQKRGSQAAAALSTLAEVDVAAFDEKQPQSDLLATAQLEGGTDTAFSLMQKPLGARGADLLYELSHLKGAPPKLQKRAIDLLSTDDVLALSSPALHVAIDLRNSGRLPPADQCRVRKQLFATAKDVGDARSLPFLRQWQDTRGCGFLHRGDCFACLHSDGSLGEAIVAITQRDKKPD